MSAATACIQSGAPMTVSVTSVTRNNAYGAEQNGSRGRTEPRGLVGGLWCLKPWFCPLRSGYDAPTRAIPGPHRNRQALIRLSPRSCSSHSRPGTVERSDLSEGAPSPTNGWPRPIGASCGGPQVARTSPRGSRRAPKPSFGVSGDPRKIPEMFSRMSRIRPRSRACTRRNPS